MAAAARAASATLPPRRRKSARRQSKVAKSNLAHSRPSVQVKLATCCQSASAQGTLTCEGRQLIDARKEKTPEVRIDFQLEVLGAYPQNSHRVSHSARSSSFKNKNSTTRRPWAGLTRLKLLRHRASHLGLHRKKRKSKDFSEGENMRGEEAIWAVACDVSGVGWGINKEQNSTEEKRNL